MIYFNMCNDPFEETFKAPSMFCRFYLEIVVLRNYYETGTLLSLHSQI